MKQDLPTIMILGVPNSGKTHIYNQLTGSYGIVSNYPMTTIEPAENRLKLLGKEYRVIDTPGFHGLFIHSEEELLVRELLYRQQPDLLLQCADANRLKQSLSLTAELAELKIPTVLCLNAVDETVKKGIDIETKTLSNELGIPVVDSISKGPSAIKRALENARPIQLNLKLPKAWFSGINDLKKQLPDDLPYPDLAASLLLQRDTTWDEYLQKNYPGQAGDWIQEAEIKKGTLQGSPVLLQRNAVAEWIGEIHRKSVAQSTPKRRTTWLEKAAFYSRQPLTGFPILLAVLLVSFFAVVHLAGWLEGLLSQALIDPLTSLLTGWVPDGFWEDLLLGDYGILSLGVFNAFGTVLPVLTVFFILFGFLEDIGYLPNLTVLVKRSFEKIGLTGKSIMPIILGFGCKTMATLTTKSISSRKEKLIAIYLIAFAIPCSAQMGLNMAILGRNGVKAFLTAIIFLVFVEIVAGLVLNKLIKQDKKTFFIQELPPFRIPSVKGILKKTIFRIVDFLKESLLIFVIAAAVLFFLDRSGLLGLLKNGLVPIVVHWLGLPIDMVDALLLTMARHEAAAGLILRMSNQGLLSPIQSVIAVVITTMFVPCFANMVAMIKEAGRRAGLIMILTINISSFILAGLLYRLLLLIF